jgi:hypothetical protein
VRRTLGAIAVAAATATALVACGEEGPPPGAQARSSGAEAGVPAGVATQYRTIAEEVKAEGGETTAGPWRIAYIVEPAEGWFEPRGDSFAWRPPARGETHHIEILPIEASTGRLVPAVPITVEVLGGDGRRVARKRLRPYYAEFFHYAENFPIPAAGDYTLRATIEPPALARHGEEAEPPALAEGAEVDFRGVRLEPLAP